MNKILLFSARHWIRWFMNNFIISARLLCQETSATHFNCRPILVIPLTTWWNRSTCGAFTVVRTSTPHIPVPLGVWIVYTLTCFNSLHIHSCADGMSSNTLMDFVFDWKFEWTGKWIRWWNCVLTAHILRNI